MNSTLVIILAALGGLLWLTATIRERFNTATVGSVRTFIRSLFSLTGTAIVPAGNAPESTGGAVTIDALERELGIEPDHYLCDRIGRINEALTARRDNQVQKKKGEVQ